MNGVDVTQRSVVSAQNGALSNPAADQSAPPPSAVSAVAAAALSDNHRDIKHALAHYDPEAIRAVDLKQFRNSDLPSSAHYLWLIPMIGWIALLCLKIYYVSCHNAGEKVLEDNKFDSLTKTSVKAFALARAREASGPLGWQYRLELARVFILDGRDFAIIVARTNLSKVTEDRGAPRQTGHYNVKEITSSSNSNHHINFDLVSFKKAPGNWVDGDNVMQMEYNDAAEALLNAAAFAKAGAQDPTLYAKAYDAYNHVMYYNVREGVEITPYDSPSRKYQRNLVAMMKNIDEDARDARTKEILAAEAKKPPKWDLIAGND